MRWRIFAVVAVVIAVVAAVMLAGGHRPSMGLTGRGAGVASVAFSPDSKIIAAADEDGFIYLWQTASGQRVITLRSPGAPPSMRSRSARAASSSPPGTTPTVTPPCGAS